MKKLKTILLYNASKYGHISLVVSIFLFAIKYHYLIILGLIYLIYLYYKFNRILIIVIILMAIIGLRYYQTNQIKLESLPIKAEVIEVYDEYIIVQSNHKYIVYNDSVSLYKPGMMVYIEGEYLENDQMHIEHNFNYNEYLKTQKILGRIVPSHLSVISQGWHKNIVSFEIKNYFDHHYSEEISTYLKLFILGHKEDLDDSVVELSNDLGISHLFAISGMHLGLIVLFLNKILQLFYLKKQTYHLILTIFLLFYNIITGFSISIVRASLFLFCIFITKDNKYKFNPSDYLSFIFIVLLIYNPYFIFSLGFQLSFLMAFVLVLFKHLYINKKGIKRLLSISLIAIVFSLPMTLAIEKSIGLFNIIINPLFIIFVSFILLPGAFILIVFPFFSRMYLYFIKAFETLMYYLSKYNFYIYFNFSNSLSKLLFWLIIILTILYYKKHKKWITFSWVLYGVFLLQSVMTHNLTKVVIFDINQGGASYIQTKDCRMLIDTGKPDDYNTLIQYFKGENIHSLDGLILTHQHEDHYGEMIDIISELNVKKVYVSNIYEDFNESIQNVVSKGDVINCGQTQIHVLNGDQEHSNENNNSLVLYTIIDEESWLFTGDIEHEIETMLIKEYDFKVDHLKVAHHGSSTSSTKAFIKHFEPKYAYISVGRNSYGLPSEKVIIDLYEQVDKLYITKDHGSIINVYHKYYQYRYTYFNGRKVYEINLNI